MASSSSASPVIINCCADGGEVCLLRISPRGVVVATVSTNEQNVIKVWDAETGQLRHTHIGHTAPVRAICFGGSWRVSGSEDQTIKLWDMTTGQEVKTLSGHEGPITALDICSDATLLVSGDAAKPPTVKLWDLATGECLSTICPDKDWKGVSGVQVHSNGVRLLVWSRGCRPQLYGVKDGQLHHKLQYDTQPTALFWDDIRNKVVVGRSEGHWEIFDSETGALIWRKAHAHPSSIRHVGFSSNFKRIISACGATREIKVWNAELGILINTLRCPGWSFAAIHARHYAGDHFVCLSKDQRQVQVWRLGVGMVLDIPVVKEDDEAALLASCMHTSADGCLASGTSDGTICIWDTKPTKPSMIRISRWKGHSQPSAITAVCMSEDGSRLAASATDGRLALWNIKEDVAELVYTYSYEGQSHKNAGVCLCMSHTDDRLICGSRDGMIRIWSMTTGQALLVAGRFEPSRAFRPLTAVDISQDGKRIACADEFYVYIIDGQTGACLQQLERSSHGAATALLFNARMDRLWHCRQSCIALSEVAAADSQQDFSVEITDFSTVSLSFACDGQWLISCHNHGIESQRGEPREIGLCARIWDPDTGAMIGHIPIDGRAALTARMNADGDQILCGMADGKVKLLCCPEGFITGENVVDSLKKVKSPLDQVGPGIVQYLKSPAFACETKADGESIAGLFLFLTKRRESDASWVLKVLEENPLIALAPGGKISPLSRAAVIQQVNLIRAILASINVLITEQDYFMTTPAGLPDLTAFDLQVALYAFPRETVESMGILWGLAKSSDKLLRATCRDRAIRGAQTAKSSVWDDYKYSKQQGKKQTSTWWSRLRMLFKRCTPTVVPKPSPCSPTVSPATGAGANKDNPPPDQTSRCQQAVAWVSSLINHTSAVEEQSLDELRRGTPMVDWVLCVPGMCDMGFHSFVATCVHVAETLDDTAIFEKQALQIVLDYKWESYARAYFLIIWALSLALAINFSFYTYYNEGLEEPQRLTWLICLLINLMPLVLQELAQIYVTVKESQMGIEGLDRSRPASSPTMRYFTNQWNLVDMVTYMGLIVAIILRRVEPYGRASYITSAIVSFLLWLKLLYYFRGFQSTGVLVRTVMQITADIRFFLVILLVFILGFGNALYLLIQVDVRHGRPQDEAMKDAFGSPKDTFVSLFSAMTGGYDLGLFSTSSLGPLPSIMYFIYVVVQAIIMLNLLIAIMGDSYDRVQDKAVGEWRCEQAKIILELEQVLPLILGEKRLKQWQMPWLHVLMEEGKESGAGEDDWAGRVKTVVRGVNAQVKTEIDGVKSLVKSEVAASQSQVKSDIEAIKSLVKSEVAAMRTESAAVRSDLAELSKLVKSVAAAVGSIQSQLKDSPSLPPAQP